jgi:hypothetical protein
MDPSDDSDDGENGDGDHCRVCFSGSSTDQDLILLCDGCDCPVHQFCYGVKEIPDDDWFCDVCAAVEPGVVVCAVCDSGGGAMKATTCGAWAHVTCAQLVPEVSFEDPFNALGINIGDISKRKGHACTLCARSGGAKIGCSRAGCTATFHPVCCAQARMLVYEQDPPGLKVLCERHRSKRSKAAAGRSRGSSSARPRERERKRAKKTARPKGLLAGAAAAPGGRLSSAETRGVSGLGAWVPDGWRCLVVPRVSMPEQSDVFYFAPDGKKLRSRPEIKRWADKQPAGHPARRFDVAMFAFSYGSVSAHLAEAAGGRCPFAACRAKAFGSKRALDQHVAACPQLLARDISGGREQVPVSAINETGDGAALPSFTYTSTVTSTSREIKLTRERPAHVCGCRVNCMTGGGCACAEPMGGAHMISPWSRLARTGSVLHECTPHCACGPKCLNRQLQNGIRFRLQVFRTSSAEALTAGSTAGLAAADGGRERGDSPPPESQPPPEEEAQGSRGWGLRALERIVRGAFVCEYAGELITEAEAVRRQHCDDRILNVMYGRRSPAKPSPSAVESDASAPLVCGAMMTHTPVP